MGSGRELLRKMFFLLGERLAFLLVITVFLVLFFIETTNTAFSEEEFVDTSYSKQGFTYDFYLGSSYSYSIDAKTGVTVSHSQENAIGHFVFPEPVSVDDGDIWEKIAACESGGNWGIVSSNGLYYGGLQFSLQAWESVGGTGLPNEASKEEQMERGKMLQEKRGWRVWGLCAKKLGLN